MSPADRGRQKAEEWLAVQRDVANDLFASDGDEAYQAFRERIMYAGFELKAEIEHEMWVRWQEDRRRALAPKAVGSPKAACWDRRDVCNAGLPANLEEEELLNFLAERSGIDVDAGYTAVYDPCIAGWYLIEGKGWILTDQLRREIHLRIAAQVIELPPSPAELATGSPPPPGPVRAIY